jgi:hypothetical protein
VRPATTRPPRPVSSLKVDAAIARASVAERRNARIPRRQWSRLERRVASDGFPCAVRERVADGQLVVMAVHHSATQTSARTDFAETLPILNGSSCPTRPLAGTYEPHGEGISRAPASTGSAPGTARHSMSGPDETGRLNGRLTRPQPTRFLHALQKIGTRGRTSAVTGDVEASVEPSTSVSEGRL